MAYVSQELKQKLSPKIKEICKRYGIKATLGVHHHSTLMLNISKGKIDFIENFNRVCSVMLCHRNVPFQPATDYVNVNPYWYHEHFDGIALAFLSEVIPAMNEGNWDKSDIQTDYFNVGWYIDVNIGRWNRPYALEK